MIVARNLSQRYPRVGGDGPLTVLDSVSLDVEAGDIVSILGPSGSGKTTLLGLLAGLDLPTEGEVVLAGAELSSLDEDARAALRADTIGFVFQNFQLVPTLTALENVLVPLELLPAHRAIDRDTAQERACMLLGRVGLESRLDHYPTQLSGGEQQRVGIARAFANEPRILFADEPTGNLDSATGGAIVELLFDLNRESGTTLVIVTHDVDLAQQTRRIVTLRSGRVESIEWTAQGEQGTAG